MIILVIFVMCPDGIERRLNGFLWIKLFFIWIFVRIFIRKVKQKSMQLWNLKSLAIPTRKDIYKAKKGSHIHIWDYREYFMKWMREKLRNIFVVCDQREQCLCHLPNKCLMKWNLCELLWTLALAVYKLKHTDKVLDCLLPWY